MSVSHFTSEYHSDVYLPAKYVELYIELPIILYVTGYLDWLTSELYSYLYSYCCLVCTEQNHIFYEADSVAYVLQMKMKACEQIINKVHIKTMKINTVSFLFLLQRKNIHVQNSSNTWAISLKQAAKLL
jgi:hypothetical protein